jgi:putative ABC transport system permease protein
MRGLISHFRYTVRLLLKCPGFTTTAVLVLGLGIGANTAIFSLVNGVLLKPLPYPRADRLIDIYQAFPGFDKFPLDYPDYLDFRRNQRSFESLTAYFPDNLALTGRGEAAVVSGLYTSGSLFKVFARPFLLGTPFSESEDHPESRPVAVISEHLWATKFQSDPNVIGANLMLNGQTFEIVGVTPGQADERGKVDIYVPLNQLAGFDEAETSRGPHFLRCIGRLKESVALEQARADLEAISKAISRQNPVTNAGWGVGLIPYLDSVVGDYSASLCLLESAVGCLLLISCANVANLLLARLQERRREVMVRSALGASRTRLIVQLLVETWILTLLGSMVGLFFAFVGVNLIKSLSPENIARFQEFELDKGSLIFVLAITCCTALLAGVLPAWVGSKVNLALGLAEGDERSGTTGPLRQRTQSFLVAGQIALTFVLLTAAGLLVRSYQVLQAVPLGFNTHQILTGDLYLKSNKYADPAKSKTVINAILDKLRKLPGVAGAALDTDLPFKSRHVIPFGIAGQTDPEPGKEPTAQPQVISGDYFSVLGIPLLSGRAFNDQDQPNKERVVIVNQSLAEHFFAGQDPIGKQLDDLADRAGLKRTYYTIVGVVPDIEHNSPEVQHASFQTYYPLTQESDPTDVIDEGTLVLSVKQDSKNLAQAIRKVVSSIDPDLPLSHVALLDQVIGSGFAARRLPMLVVSLFSGAALLLAGVGLYGVLACTVSQRGREIGIRIALGAQTRNILRLVVGQGFWIGVIGFAIGTMGAFVLGRFIQGMLYQVPSVDPLSLLMAAAILGWAAVCACLVPALRATRINPIKALRE